MQVDVLRLGEVRLPAGHPRAADRTCTILSAAVRHPDGVILFDTGVAGDHPVINEMYQPRVASIVSALNAAGIDERDVVAIVNSHLHFDHCGQNREFPNVPVWAQRGDIDLVDQPGFTVPEWARVDRSRRRSVDGDAEVAPGVEIVATPGHTPGHQSLLIRDDDVVTLLGGQCCYSGAEFAAGSPSAGDAHDETWHETAIESLERLRCLQPDVVHLSHDPKPWRPA